MSLERSDIERALNETRDASGEWNIGDAAKALGASRRTLQNRMRFYGMRTGKAGRRKHKLRYRKHRTAIGLGLGAAAVAAGALAWRKLGSPA